MAHTLASIRDQVEINLSDSSNLIWSTIILDEAIRASLLELSGVYGVDLTLKDLDAALATTFEDIDVYTLIKGAVAYALIFRVVGRYEEATPELNLTPSFAFMAKDRLEEFHVLLQTTQLRLKQLSSDVPWSGWDWEEEDSF